MRIICNAGWYLRIGANNDHLCQLSFNSRYMTNRNAIHRVKGSRVTYQWFVIWCLNKLHHKLQEPNDEINMLQNKSVILETKWLICMVITISLLSPLLTSNIQTTGTSPENPRDPSQENGKKPNKSHQLKKIFKEYGAVGVTFHIGISLVSLGMFYLIVSR